jgi:RNA polymerase sigma-70 factor (ECF subfamily)
MVEDRNALAAMLQGVAAGDRDAFEELYRRTSTKLFGVCLRLLSGKADAEEVLQEIYLAIWRKAGSFDATRGSAMTWLLTLTRNRAIDRLRSRTDSRDAPIEAAQAITDPAIRADDRMEAVQEEGRLAGCIRQLDSGDAAFIRTAFFEGATYSELATRAAMPLGTFKSRIRRALIRLRECLE